MTILQVPYHLDEYLPDLDLPLRADQVITADLPSGDVWARLAAVYRLVSDAVADTAGRGARPAVVSGDCTTALDTIELRPVPEHRVVLVGARDLDPPEVAYLAGARIERAAVADLDAAALPRGPLYVHLDLDVIDPAEVPGLRYPAPGGPGSADVARVLHMLLATGRVAAAVSPAHGIPATAPLRISAPIFKRH